MSAADTLAATPTPRVLENSEKALVWEALDLISPSYWVLKFLNWCGFDPMKKIVGPFVGDYEGTAMHAATYAQISQGLSELADELEKATSDIAAQGTWEGNAATNFQTSMTNLVSSIRHASEDINEAAKGFDDASETIYALYVTMSSLLQMALDWLAEFLLALCLPGGAIYNFFKKVPEGAGLLKRITDFLLEIADAAAALRGNLFSAISKLVSNGLLKIDDLFNVQKTLALMHGQSHVWGTADELAMLVRMGGSQADEVLATLKSLPLTQFQLAQLATFQASTTLGDEFTPVPDSAKLADVGTGTPSSQAGVSGMGIPQAPER